MALICAQYLNLKGETVKKEGLLRKRSVCVSYLEALMGLLTTGNVLSSARNGDDWHVIVVSAKELLGAWYDVSHHNGCSQGEYNMLVVGMQLKASIYLAYFSCNIGEVRLIQEEKKKGVDMITYLRIQLLPTSLGPAPSLFWSRLSVLLSLKSVSSVFLQHKKI